MHEQAGVLPWRRGDNGVEVLLITSHSGHWIVPKGMVEPDLGPEASAVDEAWEEGGVRGVITGPLGHYTTEKWDRVWSIALFAMRVDQVFETYPEVGERDRVWVPLAHASSRVRNPSLVQLLAHLTPADLFG